MPPGRASADPNHGSLEGARSLAEAGARREASLFFRLVSHRYRRGSILITTNKGIKDWPEILAGDAVLATKILDRRQHNSHVLNIKG